MIANVVSAARPVIDADKSVKSMRTAIGGERPMPPFRRGRPAGEPNEDLVHDDYEVWMGVLSSFRSHGDGMIPNRDEGGRR